MSSVAMLVTEIDNKILEKTVLRKNIWKKTNLNNETTYVIRKINVCMFPNINSTVT